MLFSLDTVNDGAFMQPVIEPSSGNISLLQVQQ